MAKLKSKTDQPTKRRGKAGVKSRDSIPAPKGWKWTGMVQSRFGYKPVIKGKKRIWLAATESEYREGMAERLGISPSKVKVESEEEWLARGCEVISGLCVGGVGACGTFGHCGWVKLNNGVLVCVCVPD